MQAHDPGCPVRVHSDEAKAASDAVNLHVSALGFDAMRKWVAVSLRNGKSDGTLYDTKQEAIRHQLDEFLCAYVCVPPNGMSPCSAESFLATHRKLYKAGFRMVDRDDPRGGRDVIPRLTIEDQSRLMSRI